MSIKAMSAVWENSKQKGNALLLLLSIADHANDETMECFPSVDRLAFKTRMSRRNVQALAKQLVADGEIEIDEQAGPKGCNKYRLTGALIAGVQKLHPCKPASERVTGGDANQRPALSPKPSVTVTGEPSGTKTPAAGAAAEKDERHKEFIDLWTESYRLQFDREYAFKGGPDGSALKRLLAATKAPTGVLMALATRAWANPGPENFWCQRAVTIVAFCTRFNEIQHELEHVRPGDVPGPKSKPGDDPDSEALYYPPGQVPEEIQRRQKDKHSKQ